MAIFYYNDNKDVGDNQLKRRLSQPTPPCFINNSNTNPQVILPSCSSSNEPSWSNAITSMSSTAFFTKKEPVEDYYNGTNFMNIWNTTSSTSTVGSTVASTVTSSNFLFSPDETEEIIQEHASNIDLEFLDAPDPTTKSLLINNDFPEGTAAARTTATNDYFLKNKTVKQNQDKENYNSLQYNNVPMWYFDNNRQHVSYFNNQSGINQADQRRYSIATSTATRPLTPPQFIQQQQQQQQMTLLNEYFKPNITTSKSSPIDKTSNLGKGIQYTPGQPIYLLQFKSNYRANCYYVCQNVTTDRNIQLNDMLFVEADRGYDLGKVIKIMNKNVSTSLTTRLDNNNVKRIFRHANQAELDTFESKKEDERNALIICQEMINEKGLDMEVVDSEYQWDRRKLTFYFKANKRIDFRELVKDLFKIYKTRIWMCAYSNTGTNSNSELIM